MIKEYIPDYIAIQSENTMGIDVCLKTADGNWLMDLPDCNDYQRDFWKMIFENEFLYSGAKFPINSLLSRLESHVQKIVKNILQTISEKRILTMLTDPDDILDSYNDKFIIDVYKKTSIYKDTEVIVCFY